MKKRITAVLTAALMATTLLPASAMAVYADDPESHVSETDIAAESDLVPEKEDEYSIGEDQPAETVILSDGEDEEEADPAEDAQEDQEELLAPPAADGMYTRNALAIDLKNLPGVYTATAYPGDNKETATMGIPSVSKQTLTAEHGPTTESPAVIMGGAVGYEDRIPGTSDFIVHKERIAPYSYFRYGVMDEAGPDGTSHKKLSGFDESYYIIRVDVSEIIEKYIGEDGQPIGGNKYLHVKQGNNKAMMVASGMDKTTYADGGGNKTGSYSLADFAAALKDTDGNYRDTPYLDIVLMTSGKLAAGADAGKEGAPSADVTLGFYVDDTEDYAPDFQPLDPAKTYTWPLTVKFGGKDRTFQSENEYIQALLEKFYADESATEENNAASYLVKGSDLEIDVVVEEQVDDDTIDEFWSLPMAMGHQEFDSHVIKLICEVPVLEDLVIEDKDGGRRDVIFDVNSFDIQIADNKDVDLAGLTIGNGATLTITDGSNTAGAELAIGNNATMVVKNGGEMIIAEDCTLEVEYDAATITPTEGGSEQITEINGEITVEAGGKLMNYGVINIEGMEAKPKDPAGEQPESGEQVITDQKAADMVIESGGELFNYGCISIKGILYVNGDLYNYGKYNDVITAGDPDKGARDYHKGIQLTWKDVVTEEGIEPGNLYLGMIPGKDGDKMDPNADLINYGDIVAVPGEIYLYGKLQNLTKDGYTGHLYLCEVTEAVIPIKPGVDDDPTTRYKRVAIIPPRESVFIVYEEQGGVFTGQYELARVTLLSNGVLGALTPVTSIEKAKAVLSSAEFTYNGTVLGPNVTKVSLNGQYLAEGVNYRVEYSNPYSKNAGDYKITVRGINEFAGTVELSYTIKPADIDKAKIELSQTAFTYNGKVQKPTVKTVGGMELVEGTDYTVTYSDKSSRAVGSYTVTVKGKGNAIGTSAKATYKINKAANTLTATPKTKSLKAAALAKKNVTVKRSQVLTVSKAQGTVTYARVSGDNRITIDKKTGNITVKKGVGKGTYKVTVRIKAAGNANYKAGSVDKTFTIKVK